MEYFRLVHLTVTALVALSMLRCADGNAEREEFDEAWYNTDELPKVDLEGLVANLSKEITWFKYVGNRTLECANLARAQSTLMIAIEKLHDCLEYAYQECASEYAEQTNCFTRWQSYAYQKLSKPCGNMRLGYMGDYPVYAPNLECKWYLEVPYEGLFSMNLTIDDFYMESSGEGCRFDSMMIYDGYSEQNRSWGKFCGRIPRFTLYGATNQMMITAKTDGYIGKYGFRAVYQVMDLGNGKNYEDPPYYRTNTGRFTLSTTPPMIYETYWEAFYYYQWTIRGDFGQKIYLKLDFMADINASAVAHDGPSFENNQLIVFNHSELNGGNWTSIVGQPQSEQTESTAFVLLVKLQRKEMNDSTTLSGQWQVVDILNMKLAHTEECLGDATMRLHDIDYPLGIGYDSDTKLKDGAPIQCFWNISSPPDFFVELHFFEYVNNASNYDRCMYEGLLIMNGNSMKEGVMRLGPMCYDDPIGFFTKNGVHNFTSSGQSLFVMFYSFLDYPSLTAGIHERGALDIAVSKTHCQGLVQACAPDQGLFPQTPFYRAETTVKNGAVHLKVFCDKAKCCRVQHLPVYEQAKYHTCHVSVHTEGKKILATSNFTTNIVVPDKGDQNLSYSCERIERIKLQNKGPYQYMCLGTQVHLTYFTDSIWALGTFTIEVKETRCGHYRPERHLKNEFYPPCAVAFMQPKESTSTIKYVDPNFQEKRFSYYIINYRNEKHNPCTKPCFSQSMQIIGEYDSYGWSFLPNDLPYVWRSWGRSKKSGNWSRELLIKRNSLSCRPMPDETTCELKVQYGQNRMNITIELPDPDVECPPRYEKVYIGCYRIIWPTAHNRKPQGVLSDDLAISSRGAKTLCEKNGGKLVSITGKEEFHHLTTKFYYDWWRNYLQFVPGIKIIHLGLRTNTETGEERWPDNQPLIFSEWYTHVYKERIPDSTISPDTGELRYALRSKHMNTSFQHLQPFKGFDYMPYRCTVMIVHGFHEPVKWLKVPCNERIPGSLPLCEAQPTSMNSEKEKVGETDMKISNITTPLNFQTVIERKNVSDRFIISEYECPTLYTMVGSKCYLYRKETKYVQLDKFKTKCREHQHDAESHSSKTAIFDDDLLTLLPDVLKLWGAEVEMGAIRISYNGSSRNPDLPLGCHALVPKKMVSINGDKSRHINWTLEKLGNNEAECNKQNDKFVVKSYLCESELKRVVEECQPHSFQCTDGTCILVHHMCDGEIDCPDASDEAYCNHVCEGEDYTEISDCYTDCHPSNCTCHETYFQCASGGCIPGSKICDYNNDCSDGSDEDICIKRSCQESREFTCHSDGRCISNEKMCDFIPDCMDGSDESIEYGNCNFDKECPIHRRKDDLYFTCDESKRCFPKSFIDDFTPDCPPGDYRDEQAYIKFLISGKLDSRGNMRLTKKEECNSEEFPCINGLRSSCFKQQKICVYDHDIHGKQRPCVNGAHLQYCGPRSCGAMFKCPNSYCLPVKKVCDGVHDCEFGEDEQQCANFQCPGMFRCKGESFCLRVSDLCNKHIDCKSHDDEELCDTMKTGCPAECECFGLVMSCVGQNLTGLPLPVLRTDESQKVQEETKILLMRNNSLNGIPYQFPNMKQLYRLDISYNNITDLGTERFQMSVLIYLHLDYNRLTKLEANTFKGLTNLLVLTLTGNRIGNIPRQSFRGLNSLPVLDLSFQEISLLEDFTFGQMPKLRDLNLSHNYIQSIPSKAFAKRLNMDDDLGEAAIKIETLRYLNIRRNPIRKTETDAFKYLANEVFMESDRFKYCCFARHIARCTPGPDEFSSCDDLIASPWLRVVIWALGILAFSGNCVILHQRMKHEKETGASLLVQHLSFADMLMGIYVLIVAGADQYHKGNYIFNADSWHNHALCKLAGFLSMLSCEMSSFVIMLITVDRLYSCVPGCGDGKGLGVRGTRGFIALGWTVCALLSVVPILEFAYFGQSGFVRGGVCTLFNVIKGRQLSGWEYSMALFVCANFVMYFVSGLGYIFVYHGMLKGIDVWPVNEELTEEEQEAERTFRKHEMVIGRRLILVVTTNFLLWTPMIAIGALALLDHHVDQVTSAWVSMFIMPLNAAINPYLYSFTTKPYRIPKDDLLANWEGDDDMDDELDLKGDTEMGDSSLGGTTMTSAKDHKAAAREAVLREML